MRATRPRHILDCKKLFYLTWKVCSPSQHVHRVDAYSQIITMWLKTLKTRLKHDHEVAEDEERNTGNTSNSNVIVWDKTTRGEENEPTITTEGALILPHGSTVKRLQKTLRYDTEYAASREPLAGKTRMPPCENVLEFRQAFTRTAGAQPPPEPTIQRVRYKDIVSHDGATIGVSRFVTVAQLRPATTTEVKSSILRSEVGAGLPSLLYVHGGGMVAGSVDIMAAQRG